MISSSFLALPDNVVVDQVRVLYDCVTVVLRSVAPSAACPLCSPPATHIHSRYQRMIADVPSGGRQVVLSLLVRKFFCQNSQCLRRIFAERLLELVRPRARMTLRFCAALEAIGFATSGEAGARLATLLGMPTSPATVLRRIKVASSPAFKKVTQVGIDDWAFRRGLKYGTILVDLQTHRVVDLLPDRAVTTATAWFKEHPDIRVISRDRGKDYATAASQGAPQAVQVADRWHIIHNLSEAVSLVLEHFRTQLRSVSQALVPPLMRELEKQQQTEEDSEEPSILIASGQPYRAPFIQQVQRTRRESRLERYQQIVGLQQQGMTMTHIAEQVPVPFVGGLCKHPCLKSVRDEDDLASLIPMKAMCSHAGNRDATLGSNSGVRLRRVAILVHQKPCTTTSLASVLLAFHQHNSHLPFRQESGRAFRLLQDHPISF